MQVVVLAGGLGTRLGALTAQTPKSLVPIDGRPFLEYQLELFRSQGLTDVVLCVGHFGEQIARYLELHPQPGISVRCSDEGEELLGTAGALRRAEQLLDEQFFLTYGDSYLFLDYREVMGYFQQRNKLALMVVYRNENRYERSNVVVEGERVVAYDKERKLPRMDYINFGISLLRREALALIPSSGSYSQEQWFQDLIEQDELLAYVTQQRFYEVGSPEGLEEFRRLIGKQL